MEWFAAIVILIIWRKLFSSDSSCSGDDGNCPCCGHSRKKYYVDTPEYMRDLEKMRKNANKK